MPEIRHFTTRRGFITAMGFGAVGLYGVWAAYGAAPLPFGGHEGAGHGAEHGAGMTPEAFRREHAAFIERFKQPDGSVEPAVKRGAEHAMDHHQMSHHDMGHMEHMDHGGAHDMAQMDHGDAQAMDHAAHGGGGDQPVDLYLLAFMWGYAPDTLRLRTGVRYRLRMMADDIPHGASLQLGAASRIIRLRPDVVGEQTVTFTKPGTVLIYCTAYCGPGHDQMQGKIVVTAADQGGQS